MRTNLHDGRPHTAVYYSGSEYSPTRVEDPDPHYTTYVYPVLIVPGVQASVALEADNNGGSENWNPSRHTVPLPTNAYGCIDFQGNPRTPMFLC